MLEKLELKLLDNLKNSSQVENKHHLFSELEILKNKLYSSIFVEQAINNIKDKNKKDIITYTFKKWFSFNNIFYELWFLKNNNFLEFNYYFGDEKMRDIAVWLDIIRDLIADGNSVFEERYKPRQYKEIDIDDIIIFIFIISKNQGKVKRIIKLIVEFLLVSKMEINEIEELNDKVSEVINKNFANANIEEKEYNLKSFLNLSLFNKDLRGRMKSKQNFAEKKNRINLLLKNIYRGNKKENPHFLKIRSYDQVLEEFLNYELKDETIGKDDLYIKWFTRFFNKKPVPLKDKEGFIFNKVLNNFKVKIFNNIKNNLEVVFESPKNRFKLIFLNNTIDRLYLILWLKCLGIERLKFFLDFNKEKLDLDKMKKFGRWENVAEVSNKIKDLLNTNQTINAFGYEIYLYKTNENYRINDAIILLSNSNIISLLKSEELNKFFGTR